ncbi:hypothetical protein CLOSTASPAR_03790 [[Clostridium] asparagiforme DSM 15981]|uniref:Uncharacterized protein n=1 Tax=[Clostridium] asparagiforme DSM 15981 TaxID=518636 RepID=C0D3E9_9FIRM|nr:hypothetical protein CLOSTASPAR_03790 [[Clostridium] asparagiforme DSM 15981]
MPPVARRPSGAPRWIQQKVRPACRISRRKAPVQAAFTLPGPTAASNCGGFFAPLRKKIIKIYKSVGSPTDIIRQACYNFN